MKIYPQIYYSVLICQVCGSKFTIPRKKCEKREANHIKHLYCIKCKKRTPHIENIR